MSECAAVGGRVARGLLGRPQWKLNGKLLREREERRERGGMVSLRKKGTSLSLTSVSVRDAGSYSCHCRNDTVSSFRVVVAGEEKEDSPRRSV